LIFIISIGTNYYISVTLFSDTFEYQNFSIPNMPEVTSMRNVRLSSLVFFCSTISSLVAAYPAFAAEVADQQPALEAASTHGYVKMPPEQPVITTPPESMPTDEFGRELNYCLLPWDYLPGEQQPKEVLDNSIHP
jgi:hypothetical protein